MEHSTATGKRLSIYFASCGSVAGLGLQYALRQLNGISVLHVQGAAECLSSCQGAHDLMIFDAAMIESFDCLNRSQSCMTSGRANLIVIDFDVSAERLIYALGVGARGYWLYNDPFDGFVSGLFQVAEGNWSFSPRIQSQIEIRKGFARYNPLPIRSLLEKLTVRQAEVCMLLAVGMTVKEVAERLGIAYSTAEKHKRMAMTRLGVRRAIELMRLLIDHDRQNNAAEHGDGADPP